MKKYFLILVLFLTASGFLQVVEAQPYCNQAQSTPGFPTDIPCQTAICAIDAYCCNVSWDAICASEATAEPACVNCLEGMPPNIVCAGAIALSTCTLYAASTVLGSTLGNPPSCAGVGLSSANGLWYSFMGTGATMTVTTNNTGTNFDTQIGVFSGTCGALVCVGANDDAGYGVLNGLTSQLTFATVAGTQYFIYVTGNFAAVGEFVLSIGPSSSAPPTLVNCPPHVSAYTDPGVCSAYVVIPAPVEGINYSDDCTATMVNSITGTDNATENYLTGVTGVIWTVVDMNGQTASCVQRVFVDDTSHATLEAPASIVQSNDLDQCDAVITYAGPVLDELCPGVGIELLLNGHFESAVMAPWMETGNNGMGCDADFTVYSGNSDPCGYAAGLGVDFTPPVGNNAMNAGLDGAGPMKRTLQQFITLPTFVGRADLSFHHAYYVDLLNYCSGCSGTRMLDVMFLDETLNVIDTIYHQAFAPGAVYTQNFTFMQFDVQNLLAPYAGGNVYLNVTLTIPETFTGPGMYAIDNVSLSVNGVHVEQISGLPSGSSFPVGTTLNVFQATASNGFVTDTCIQTVTVQDSQLPALCEPVPTAITTITSSSLNEPPFSVLSDGLLSGRPNADGTCCNTEDPFTKLLTFTVDLSGSYTIHQVQDDFDGYLLLYTDPFSLAVNPPTSFVAGNDDYMSASESRLEDILLQTGQVYYLYSTAYSTGNGSFTTTFSGPGNVWISIIPCQQDLFFTLDSGQCTKVVNYAIPTATDNCVLDTLMLVSGFESGSAFPSGNTVVEYTAIDVNGNVSSYSFTVRVGENVPPVAVAPADVVVPADSASCSATGVSLGLPTATDNCSASFFITNNAQEPYPIGTSMVVWQVQDASGNKTSVTQNVTVLDIEPPVLVHADTTVVYDSTICGAYVHYTPPQGMELCSGRRITQNSDTETIEAGIFGACANGPDTDTNSFIRMFDLSEYSTQPDITLSGVRFGVEDAFDPTGYQDIQINLYTVHDTLLLENMQLLCSQTLSLPNQSLSSVSVPVNLTISTDSILVIEIYSAGIYSDGTIFFIGANTAPESEPSYLVAPLCGILQPYSLESLGLNGVSYLIDFSTEENVVTTLVSGIGSDGFFPVGTNTETYQSTDEEGNSAQLSFNVTVLDTHAPVLACAADTTVSTTAGMCGALYTLPLPLVKDACGLDTLTNNAPAVFPVGITPVTWTAVDRSGNITTCAHNVTVIDDENPEITCPANVSVPNDPGFSYATNVTLGTPIVDDNCGLANVINNAVEPYPAGTNIVTWIVSDVYGNMSSCAQTVTVNSDIGIAGYVQGGDLLRNDPNPFHDRTTITFFLNQTSEVSMRIMDVVGQTVSVVFEGTSMQAGAYTETFDAQAHHMAPGIYYLQMTVNGNRLVSKMMVE